jgi:MFS family permease
MNPKRLFVASCIALITSAFTFIIRGEILQPLGKDFALTQEQLGNIAGAAFRGMAVAMLIGGVICDAIGMRRVLDLAWLCHMVGVLATVFAPQLFALPAFEPYRAYAYTWLYAASLITGCGNGLVEVAINPLAATLFPDRKTHYLNVLHAWWPGGLILGGLLAKALGGGIDFGVSKVPGLNLGWQWAFALILVPCLTYGAMIFGQKFPVTERVESGVSTAEMFREALRPMFLLWAFCMLLTASTELGPNQWIESVLPRTAGVSGTVVLIYTSGLMFVMRFFAGPLAHALSPVGMLTVSAALAGTGLYLLSYATTGLTAFAFATVFGVGIAYFWPTMLGVTAERFPKGGALLLCLMGSVGNLAISQALPAMGQIVDRSTVAALGAADGGSKLVEELTNDTHTAIDPDKVKALAPDSPQLQALRQAEAIGFASAFRWMSLLSAVLVVVFGLIALTDWLGGGYKAVRLKAEH